MEIIWHTRKVVDADGVVTHIDWTAEAINGVRRAEESGRADVPAPAQDVLDAAKAEHARRGEPTDVPGFVRASWVQRTQLKQWLEALIDVEAIEAALTAKVADIVEDARNANPELFSNTDSPQTVSDPMGEALDRQREANKQLCAPAIPDEIAKLLEPGETLTKDVRRKLTERLNVELAELKNLRGLAGEDLKREAEIEKLLGLFARLGEI